MDGLKLSLAIITAILYCLKHASAATDWSTCSKTCGGGNQWKEVCVWGFCRGKNYRSCNTQACVSGWGVWSACSKTCGGGSRFKVDKCALNDILKCPKTYADCGETPCKRIPSCGGGRVHRYEDDSSCCKKSARKCGVVDESKFQRIFGGQKADLGAWPWAIVIFDKNLGIGRCGASLIHPSWAVTARHCLYIGKANMKLIFGTISIKNPATGSIERAVDEAIPHPDYAEPLHDIGLLKFKTPVTYSATIKPICLPSGEVTREDKSCFATGWGISNKADLVTRTPSDVLMQVDLRILPLDACVKSYKGTVYENGPTADTFCVGRHGGVKDACAGDSGGPLACQRCSSCEWYLSGVVSFGAVDCASGGRPGVFVKVRHYETWIKRHVPMGDTGYYIC